MAEEVQPQIDALKADIEVIKKDLIDLSSQARNDWFSSRAVFTRSLEAAGKFALHDITPDQITADQNNYNPQGNAVIRLSSDASRSITGFDGGDRGRVLLVVNAGSNDIVLKDENASSSASNRITTPGGGDVTLAAEWSAMLFYDITSSRWRLLWYSPTSVTPTEIECTGLNKALIFGAINSDWTRMAVVDSAASTTVRVLVNKGGVKTNAFLYSQDVAVTPVLPHMCFDSGSGKFLMVANTGTAPYKYDNADNLANETALTVSGATLVSAIGIASDGTNIYILDDNTGGGGHKRVMKFTLSGSTLTHVSTTNLGNDNSNRSIAVIGDYWYCNDFTNKLIRRFDTSGTAQGTIPNGVLTANGSNQLIKDPEGELRILMYHDLGTSFFSRFVRVGRGGFA